MAAALLLAALLVGGAAALVLLNPLQWEDNGTVELRGAAAPNPRPRHEEDVPPDKGEPVLPRGAVSARRPEKFAADTGHAAPPAEPTPAASVGKPAAPPGSRAAGSPTPERPDKPAPGSLASVDLIEQLHQKCRAMKWAPATAAQYATHQELARYVTAAQFLTDDASVQKGLRVIIGAAAQEVLDDLSKTPWPEQPRLAKVNRLAVEGLKRPGRALFAYVEVAYTSHEAEKVDGVPSVVVQLIGTGQLIVVPVREDPADLHRRSRWLLMGVHDPAIQFSLSTSAADEPAQTAPLVRAKYLVGRPIPVPPKPGEL